MDSSSQTQEIASVTEMPSAQPEDTHVHPSLLTTGPDQCPTCRATLAPDQRYCLECGRRRSDAKLPFSQAVSQPGVVAVRRPSLRSMSANSTLIAGIGTLLLAMGVGVLIGRSGGSGGRSAAPSIVTVAGGGGPTATGAPAAGAVSGAAATAAGAKAAAAKPSGPVKLLQPKKSVPPPKVVKVGSPGRGPGYQNGKFTGNFFGP